MQKLHFVPIADEYKYSLLVYWLVILYEHKISRHRRKKNTKS